MYNNHHTKIIHTHMFNKVSNKSTTFCTHQGVTILYYTPHTGVTQSGGWP